ncbi:MAG: hypothetical protein ACYC0V_03050 [Armatimonadota bacterium]
MKKSVSPGVVVLIIAVVVIIIGLIFMKGGTNSTKEDQIKEAIMNQSGQGGGTPVPEMPIPNKK